MDTENSCGNYISDLDGNKYLDIFTSIAAIGHGYNHPALLEVANSDAVRRQVALRAGCGIHPTKEWLDLIQKAYLDVAPPGMTRVGTLMCGSCAVECAIKVAMITYAQEKRGGPTVPPTQEELDSCLCAMPPGTANVGVLAFKTGFHGRLFASLSASTSAAAMKYDFPAFDWPHA